MEYAGASAVLSIAAAISAALAVPPVAAALRKVRGDGQALEPGAPNRSLHAPGSKPWVPPGSPPLSSLITGSRGFGLHPENDAWASCIVKWEDVCLSSF